MVSAALCVVKPICYHPGAPVSYPSGSSPARRRMTLESQDHMLIRFIYIYRYVLVMSEVTLNTVTVEVVVFPCIYSFIITKIN